MKVFLSYKTIVVVKSDFTWQSVALSLYVIVAFSNGDN